jgi:hypothetical protein
MAWGRPSILQCWVDTWFGELESSVLVRNLVLIDQS